MRKTPWMLVGALFAALPPLPAMAGSGDGLKASSSAQMTWARWQGRLSLVTTTDPWRLGVEGPSVKLSSASLMGDYYFGRSLVGANQVGGLRATSGLIFGPRSALGSAQTALGNGREFSVGSRSSVHALQPYATDLAGENATAPYLGIGYTGLSPRSGWGFSADLGLVAKSRGNALRAGSGQNLDDQVRDLRMTPLLQFGVSYGF